MSPLRRPIPAGAWLGVIRRALPDLPSRYHPARSPVARSLCQDQTPHGNGIRCGIVLLTQSGHGEVDLAGHRLGIELVQVSRGSSGEELRSAHPKIVSTTGRLLEGLIRYR